MNMWRALQVLPVKHPSPHSIFIRIASSKAPLLTVAKTTLVLWIKGFFLNLRFVGRENSSLGMWCIATQNRHKALRLRIEL